MRILLITLTLPWHRKALPDRHIRLRLRHQRIANVLLAPARPGLVVLLTQWPNRHIYTPAHELPRGRGGLGCNSVNNHLEFLTVGLEGQVVDVVAEGIFDFASDGGEDAAGDGDSVQVVPELEGQHHYVDPTDLRDPCR
jgi:hypothetical protein